MKGKLLTIVFLAVVAAGAVWFFVNKGDGTSTVDLGDLTQEHSEGEPFSGSLKAAVALGIPMKCSYEVNGVKYSGIIKGKQYKGSVKTQDGGDGTVLIKGNCMYTWSNVDKQGIKMCFEEGDQSMWEDSGGSVSEGVVPIGYTCYPTLVSDSEFDLPTGIDFMDFNAPTNIPGMEF